MAIIFVVTVDTEADDKPVEGKRRYQSIVEELPRFQDLCDSTGVRPTYLVTYDAIRCDAARETLGRLATSANCEIGTHLHAWTTPPQYPLPREGADHSPYLHEYPVEIQQQKIANHTQLVADAFTRPTAFRGGRWGMDETAVALLAEQGYVADCSVTPGVSWRSNGGYSPGSAGPDFTASPAWPHGLRAGQYELLEVPVSIAPQGALKGLAGRRLSGQWGRLVEKSGLCRMVWLRPGFSTFEQMRGICRDAVRKGAPVLNLMFRSADLNGPEDRKDEGPVVVEDPVHSLPRVVEYVMGELGARSLTLSEYAASQTVTPP